MSHPEIDGLNCKLDQLEDLIGKLELTQKEIIMNIRSGELVVCRDNQNVEEHVIKNEYYRVDEVQYRGALLKVQGVVIPLASTRFTPVRLVPPEQEGTNADY